MKAQAAPQIAMPRRKAKRSCAKHAVSRTIAAAPTNVPTRRAAPLRSDAPTPRWQTIAAEVAAQKDCRVQARRQRRARDRPRSRGAGQKGSWTSVPEMCGNHQLAPCGPALAGERPNALWSMFNNDPRRDGSYRERPDS